MSVEDFDARLRNATREELERLSATLRDSDTHSNVVGRVLRAHLAVEIRLRHHIEVINPNLGSLEPIGLNFDRLRKIYSGLPNYSMPWLTPGLEALNRVRNKFAHSLSAEITPNDLRPMAALVAMMQDVMDQDSLERHPVATCEMFAMLAALVFASLQTGYTELQNLEAEVLAIHREALRVHDELASDDRPDGQSDA